MDETICLDTSVLIDHKRSKSKTDTLFFILASSYQQFAISTVTVFELWRGDSQPDEKVFWSDFISRMQILPFDTAIAKIAGLDYLYLEKSGQRIGVEDVLIGATAKRHNLRLATTNVNHFSRIPHLGLVDL